MQVAEVFAPLFTSRKTFNVLAGGRGSGKSYAAALYAVKRMREEENLLVLVCREYMSAISESSKNVLEEMVASLKLENDFEISRNEIECKVTGSRAIFKGLERSVGSVRSIEGVGLCIIDEGQLISRASMRALLPSIRKQGAQFLFIINPTNAADPIYADYIKNHDPKTTLLIKANLEDNPFASDLLIMQRDHAKRTLDPGEFEHVWGGTVWGRSSDLVINPDSWRVGVTDEPGPRSFGLDLGTAHATCGIAIRRTGPYTLYVENEVVAHGGVLVEELQDFLAPLGIEEGDTVWSDHQALQSKTLKLKHIRKGPNSVTLGLQYIRQFQIIINPQCKRLIDELSTYRYKRDQRTELLTDQIIKQNDDAVDAFRYAVTGAWRDIKREQRNSGTGHMAEPFGVYGGGTDGLFS